jgi:hypothetical protein
MATVQKVQFVASDVARLKKEIRVFNRELKLREKMQRAWESVPPMPTGWSPPK